MWRWITILAILRDLWPWKKQLGHLSQLPFWWRARFAHCRKFYYWRKSALLLPLYMLPGWTAEENFAFHHYWNASDGHIWMLLTNSDQHILAKFWMREKCVRPLPCVRQLPMRRRAGGQSKMREPPAECGRLGNLVIDIANVSTYDKSDNHVLFTLSL